MKVRILLLLLILAGAGLIAGVAMAKTEEPDYSVVETYDDWELRRYGPTIEASVVTDGDFRPAVSAGFRLLAKYIFGSNRLPDSDQSQKIAMTAPVSAAPTPAPSSEALPRWTITFTMPSSFQMSTLPRPLDSRVMIHQTTGGLYAAKRFSGQVRQPEDWKAHDSAVRTALADKGLTATGVTLTAQYNGPWVPGPFRRNEVLIPVGCKDSADTRCQDLKK
jgi:hypothetical protein